jgi:cysteinyl-tRNA synthetase
MLTLYDTRRRRRRIFRSRRQTVSLYVCGVTPYDTTHLEHARTFLVFDVLVRHLEAAGQQVRYVQNLTDIDESILQRGPGSRVVGRLGPSPGAQFSRGHADARMAATECHAACHQ